VGARRRLGRGASACRQHESCEHQGRYSHRRLACTAVDLRHLVPFSVMLPGDWDPALWRHVSIVHARQPPGPKRAGPPPLLLLLPLLDPPGELPNSEPRALPPAAPTRIDSALTVPSAPVAPVTTIVSPGWMPLTLALTVLVTVEAAEVVTLTVFTWVSVTYRVLPWMKATCPLVGAAAPALAPAPPPAPAPAKPPPPVAAPAPVPLPRRAANREARLPLLAAELAPPEDA